MHIKRCILILSAAIVVALCAACGNAKPANEASTETLAASAAITETAATDDLFIDAENDSSYNFVIDEQVIYESDKARVTALKAESNSSQTCISVKVENLSDKKAVFNLNDGESFVNGLSMDVSVYFSLAPGKSETSDIYIDNEMLRLSGIKEINDIRMNWTMSDDETYEEITSLKDIQIKSKTYSKDFKQDFNSDGEVLYEKDGVIIRYVGKEKWIEWDTTRDCLLFSLENSSNNDFSFYCDDSYVDDEKVNIYGNNSVGTANSKGYIALMDYETESLSGHIELDLVAYSLGNTVNIDFDKTV